MKKRLLFLIAAVTLAGEWAGFGQTIVWSGGGDASSWTDPNNWVGSQEPGSANNVVITNGAGTNVVISSAVTVESIRCNKTLTIASGSLAVTTGSSSVQGMFTASVGTTLSASGSGTTLTSSGPVDIDNASLYVSGGATLSLAGAVEYNHSAGSDAVLQASGSGSAIDLTGLTNFTAVNGGSYYPLMIEALAGGAINLDAMVSSSNGIVQVEATGVGSEVNLSALRVFSGYTGNINEGGGVAELQASSGGTLLVGQLGAVNAADISEDGTGTLGLNALTNLTDSTLTVSGGTVTLTNLTDIDNANLYVSGGATLSLPGAVAYDHSADSETVLQASGPGSVLALTGLTNVTGMNAGSYNALIIQALAGGAINLDGLISSSIGIVQIKASGSGSEVNLSALRVFSGYSGNINEGEGFSELQASSGGTVLVGQLGVVNTVGITEDGTGTLNLNAITNLAGSTLTVSGGTVSLTNLTDIDNANLYVTSGATLSLPRVAEFSHSADSISVFQASGSGSVLALPGLTNVSGTNGGSYNALMIQALAGGMINLDGLLSSSNAIVQMEASGSGSEVNLSGLRVFSGYAGNIDEGEGFSELQASSGGTVLVGQLGTVNAVGISEDGTGTLNLNALTNLTDSTLTVSGGTVTLTGVADIDNTSLYVSSGAALSLPGAVGFQAGCQNVVWQASGAGSLLQMSHLTNIVGSTCGYFFDIQALAGGQVLLGDLQSITNGGVAILSDGAGSTINLIGLSDFVLQSGEGSVTAQNGGTIILNPQPLLLGNVAIDIATGTPGLPPAVVAPSALTLFATPWDSYRVEELNPLLPGSPLATILVPLTNNFQSIAILPAANTTFQVTEFVANPPILQLGLTPDNQVQLVLFGETNATYQIQSTPNLRAPITWTPGSVAAMTNSFRIFPETPPEGPSQFYRAQQQ